MKLIVGLGNPGKEFENTYHNLGFCAIDMLSKKFGVSLNKSKFNSLYAQCKFNDEIVLLIKPLTYMNLSGQAVKQFVDYYKLQPSDVIVICDDIDLPKGTNKLREHGSGGTHNGLKNIVYKLNSQDFKRLKIGAGDNNIIDLKDYVLSKIDEQSLNLILPSLQDGLDKVLNLLKNKV